MALPADQTTRDFTGRRVLIIVENLPSPFDRRVWQEALALRDNGAQVTIICPTGKGYEEKYEMIEGIAIFRYNLPMEAQGARGYLIEYSFALFWQWVLTVKCFFSKGFDVIQACNPPDLIFLVALPFKALGKRFVFDHHDLNPELYVAKFGRKDFFYRLLLFFEWMTFKAADVSIATNDSYRRVALERGGKKPDDVFVVRSGPSLERMRKVAPNNALKKGRKYLVGYVGVIGKQEGLPYLVDACAYIVNTKGRNDVHFICVGGGTDLEDVKAYAHERMVQDYFTFTGRAPDQEMLEALNTADICVNPDEYNEMNDKSTMNKVMEYMALGKPIVQFDLTEGRVTAQDASLYAERNNPVDLANKLLTLLDDPGRRRHMGELGYKRISDELEWAYEVNNLYRCYRRVFSPE
jgi:glycosyltransferase involved in cell wall biosynthesis